MAAFRREEDWNHTATIVAAIYQSVNAEADRVFWPQQFHPDYEAIEAEATSSKIDVPQKVVFDLMKNVFVGGK